MTSSFRSSARRRPPACSISGAVTLALASAGHLVTGVDPARASLDAARAKPGAERVTWVEGTARSLPTADFDVATMTAHVAQFLWTSRPLRTARSPSTSTTSSLTENRSSVPPRCAFAARRARRRRDPVQVSSPSTSTAGGIASRSVPATASCSSLRIGHASDDAGRGGRSLARTRGVLRRPATAPLREVQKRGRRYARRMLVVLSRRWSVVGTPISAAASGERSRAHVAAGSGEAGACVSAEAG